MNRALLYLYVYVCVCHVMENEWSSINVVGIEKGAFRSYL
jgi:hypothetical protein